MPFSQTYAHGRVRMAYSGGRLYSRYIQEIVRPHVVRPNLEAAYAEMAKDKQREKEAQEWAENTFKDITDETP